MRSDQGHLDQLPDGTTGKIFLVTKFHRGERGVHKDAAPGGGINVFRKVKRLSGASRKRTSKGGSL